MKHEIKKDTTERLLKFYKHGKWKSIIDLFHEEVEEGKESFYDQRYLWVRPSEDNLQFIKQQTVKAGCCQLVSIGCGSGLLEWLIHAATGLEVSGIEVDRGWWESPYAPPVFLPLIYADEAHHSDITTNKNAALLFCYFNNGSAFSEYMRQYQGTCFIVIGPGEGRDAEAEKCLHEKKVVMVRGHGLGKSCHYLFEGAIQKFSWIARKENNSILSKSRQ